MGVCGCLWLEGREKKTRKNRLVGGVGKVWVHTGLLGALKRAGESLVGEMLHYLCIGSCLFSSIPFDKLRSEQAPGSGFHLRDESDKIDCEMLGPSWCKKKVDPER